VARLLLLCVRQRLTPEERRFCHDMRAHTSARITGLRACTPRRPARQFIGIARARSVIAIRHTGQPGTGASAIPAVVWLVRTAMHLRSSMVAVCTHLFAGPATILRVDLDRACECLPTSSAGALLTLVAVLALRRACAASLRLTLTAFDTSDRIGSALQTL
jgi:hypothetical protein